MALKDKRKQGTGVCGWLKPGDDGEQQQRRGQVAAGYATTEVSRYILLGAPTGTGRYQAVPLPTEYTQLGTVTKIIICRG